MTDYPPGVYDIPEDVYHASDGLSSSGAKRLLPPSVPAVYQYERDHGGRPDKAAFDFGHAAHKEVLGIGARIYEVTADDWRSKAAKEQAAEARAAGATPLLSKDMETVRAMTAALRTHPRAALLLDPEHGTPETSLFARDPETGVLLRGRLDWLPDDTPGRMVIPDYKTAVSARPADVARTAAKYGYHLQAAWYMELVRLLNINDNPAFVLISQEKTPPYLVSVVELDSAAVALGRRLMRRAIDTYAWCVENDTWPGYPEDVELVALPRWVYYEEDDE